MISARCVEERSQHQLDCSLRLRFKLLSGAPLLVNRDGRLIAAKMDDSVSAHPQPLVFAAEIQAP